METISAPNIDTLSEAVLKHIDDSGAEIGVGIRHVESGAELFVHPDALYPMASVFKIPILIETLAQADEGRQSLDTRVELRPENKVLPSGVLVEMQPGLRPTLHDLLMLMIIQSDNTATDLVLAQIGIEAIEPRLRSFGCGAITIKMSVQGLFDNTFGPVDTTLPPTEIVKLIEARAPFWDALTNQRVLENNVASPRDTCRLLERLVRGELLSPASTEVALDIMKRQQLNLRLPRFMPDQVSFAHKTGTFIQSRNDAGIIFLPDGSHLVVVTFAILAREPLDADPLVRNPYIDRVDSAMGYIARTAYDAFAGTSSEQ
jgi:beta-lactamase class A